VSSQVTRHSKCGVTTRSSALRRWRLVEQRGQQCARGERQPSCRVASKGRLSSLHPECVTLPILLCVCVCVCVCVCECQSLTHSPLTPSPTHPLAPQSLTLTTRHLICTQVYAISDLHTDVKANFTWLREYAESSRASHKNDVIVVRACTLPFTIPCSHSWCSVVCCGMAIGQEWEWCSEVLSLDKRHLIPQ
jgi:hypothetical protein